MFTTSYEFGQTVVPASAHTISERNRRIKAALSQQLNNVSKDDQAGSPMSGNWTKRKQQNLNDNPAGIRIPKEFKRSLADKIPNLIEKLKKEGKDE